MNTRARATRGSIVGLRRRMIYPDEGLVALSQFSGLRVPEPQAR
jgi:hypothetical protein